MGLINCSILGIFDPELIKVAQFKPYCWAANLVRGGFILDSPMP